MDTIQLLLIVILMVTTILMIVIGISLFFVLRDLRKELRHENKNDIHHKDNQPAQKNSKKKYYAIGSIMSKIKTLSPNSSKKRQYFVKH